MPRSSKPKTTLNPALSEPECKALFEFLRVSDSAVGPAKTVEKRLLTSLALAYRSQTVTN